MYNQVTWQTRQAFQHTPNANERISPATILGHELTHRLHVTIDADAFNVRRLTMAAEAPNREELLTMRREATAAMNFNESPRREYAGARFIVNNVTETAATAFPKLQNKNLERQFKNARRTRDAKSLSLIVGSNTASAECQELGPGWLAYAKQQIQKYPADTWMLRYIKKRVLSALETELH